MFLSGTKIQIGNEGKTKRHIKRHSEHKKESHKEEEMLLVLVLQTLLRCSN